MRRQPSPPPFVVEPHSFEFKPGIDTNKLNQLLDDLDAEEFLRKMAASGDAQPPHLK
jgi:hypothetical protein